MLTPWPCDRDEDGSFVIRSKTLLSSSWRVLSSSSAIRAKSSLRVLACRFDGTVSKRVGTRQEGGANE